MSDDRVLEEVTDTRDEDRGKLYLYSFTPYLVIIDGGTYKVYNSETGVIEYMNSILFDVVSKAKFFSDKLKEFSTGKIVEDWGKDEEDVKLPGE